MNTTRGVISEELGSGTVEVFSLPTDEATLTSLVTDIFTDWWEHIHFGVIVQGAAWEVAAPNAPVRIGSLDGYITVNFGRWHFHLCIGEHTASGPELGRIRRCARAEMYRILYDGKPGSCIGRHLLRGNLASALAGSLMVLGRGAHGPLSTLIGQAWARPAELRRCGQWRVTPEGPRYARRTCCGYTRLAGGRRCGDCSLSWRQTPASS